MAICKPLKLNFSTILKLISSLKKCFNASIDALVPARLPSVPRDPFTTDAPLHLKATSEELLIWSVGPDGEDDGGPQPPDAEHDAGNDDIGLRMRAAAAAAR